MLIISVKDGENIERALKRYKKKFDRTKVIRQLRARKNYIKPSVANRKARLKAIYRDQVMRDREMQFKIFKFIKECNENYTLFF